MLQNNQKYEEALKYLSKNKNKYFRVEDVQNQLRFTFPEDKTPSWSSVRKMMRKEFLLRYKKVSWRPLKN